jgi:long-chain acyl-CoA synthetase|tara:strand:+ start:368 stop:2002 length:1635 start_codon:yes stop_codon:yes gene_type:complete
MSYLLPLQQFSQRVKLNPDQPYLHQPVDSLWTTYSFKDVDTMARKIASGLLDQGYQKGDRIAILAKNCAEWVVADLAIMMAGMISIPIYTTANVDTIKYAISHSGATAIFMGKLDDTRAAEEACRDLKKIAFPYPTVESEFNWNHWLENYAPLIKIDNPASDNTLTIVYTSGSTGDPKGVVLAHGHLAVGVKGVDDFYSAPHNRVLSYLPMAHIAERALVIMGSIYYSVEIFFNESLNTFAQDLHHAQVTIFLAVPRIWTKLQFQVLATLKDAELQPLLVSNQGAMIAAQIREKLGFKHCKVFASGAAPIAPSLLEWYGRIGIDISEGYGMTETGGLVCSNTPFSKERLGGIGIPVKGLEVKLSDQGEILVRGASVFNEYYKNPKATQETFDQGWLKTGDRGIVDENEGWRITGRFKEQFKTAKGKYVAPVPIELLVSENTSIEQVCVTGSGMPQPVALVVLNVENGHKNQEVVDSLNCSLDKLNGELESHERLAALFVVDTPWTIENELLTPTMKLKRHNIERRYREVLMATNPNGVVWETDI